MARLLIVALLLASSIASADTDLLARPTTRTWPFAINVHVLAGIEPHAVGTPPAFGMGGEFLWHGRIGFFVELLASNGSAVLVGAGANRLGLPDRISAPFGLSVRPFSWLVGADDRRFAARLLEGIGAQVGVSVEHMLSSNANATTAAFHLAAICDVPLYGSPRASGAALRIEGRGIFQSEYRLETDQSVRAHATNGQLLVGFAFVI